MKIIAIAGWLCGGAYQLLRIIDPRNYWLGNKGWSLRSRRYKSSGNTPI